MEKENLKKPILITALALILLLGLFQFNGGLDIQDDNLVANTYSSNQDKEPTVNSGAQLSALITASPSNIALGQSTVISWESDGATDCYSREELWMNDATSGSVTVSPKVTTTYELQCRNRYGSVTDYVTVTVDPSLRLDAFLENVPNTYSYKNPADRTQKTTDIYAYSDIYGWLYVDLISPSYGYDHDESQWIWFDKGSKDWVYLLKDKKWEDRTVIDNSGYNTWDLDNDGNPDLWEVGTFEEELGEYGTVNDLDESIFWSDSTASETSNQTIGGYNVITNDQYTYDNMTDSQRDNVSNFVHGIYDAECAMGVEGCGAVENIYVINTDELSSEDIEYYLSDIEHSGDGDIPSAWSDTTTGDVYITNETARSVPDSTAFIIGRHEAIHSIDTKYDLSNLYDTKILDKEYDDNFVNPINENTPTYDDSYKEFINESVAYNLGSYGGHAQDNSMEELASTINALYSPNWKENVLDKMDREQKINYLNSLQIWKEVFIEKGFSGSDVVNKIESAIPILQEEINKSRVVDLDDDGETDLTVTETNGVLNIYDHSSGSEWTYEPDQDYWDNWNNYDYPLDQWWDPEEVWNNAEIIDWDCSNYDYPECDHFRYAGDSIRYSDCIAENSWKSC